MRHTVEIVDPIAKTGRCRVCGLVRLRRKGRRLLCAKSQDRWRKRVRKPYRAHVDLTCTRCGFVAIHRCQIDKHHIDGNHDNNDPLNLENICANCHRIQSWAERHPEP